MGEESRHRWLQSVFILKEISQSSPYDADEINSVFGCQHILCLKRSSMLSEPGILYRGNMEAAICAHPLLPPFLLLKCQAKITAATLAVHGQMQQRLLMLKRIKFLFVQSQLHNLLPGPVTGTYLFWYQVQPLSPCCQTDATTVTLAGFCLSCPSPRGCTEERPLQPPHPAGRTHPFLLYDLLLFPS